MKLHVTHHSCLGYCSTFFWAGRLPFSPSFGSTNQGFAGCPLRFTAALIVLGFSIAVVQPLRADILINATEAGGNVTISFNGSLSTNTAPDGTQNQGSNFIEFQPGNDAIIWGTGTNLHDRYLPGSSGWSGTDFSSAPIFVFAAGDSFSGSTFGLNTSGLIQLPAGYVDGTDLSGSMTFNGQSFASLGLDPNTEIVINTNFGKIIFFPQPPSLLNTGPPPSLHITGPPRSFRYRNRLTVRGTSSKPLDSLQAKWSGRRGFKTTQLGGATSWRVKIPRNILRSKRTIIVRVRGIDEQGQISSIVKREY